MKLLLDIGVGRTAAQALRQQQHDVSWLGEWRDDPGDTEILARAHQEGRILVTIDKDFGELAVLHRQRHSGIVRLVYIDSSRQCEAIATALDRHGAELHAGAIVTVEPGRVRIRPAES